MNNKLTPKQIFKKSFAILGGVAFFSASIGGVARMLTNSSNADNSQEEQLSPEAQLKQKAEGYELVLAREPENPFVIDNLLSIYVELKDFEKALPLAEKLVALQPENTRYKQNLAVIKRDLAKSPENRSPQQESQEVVTTEEEK